MKLAIHFKQADGHTGGGNFYGRAILYYFYDDKGNPVRGQLNLANYFRMDGVSYSGHGFVDGYVYYMGSRSSWKKREEGVVNLEIDVMGDLSRPYGIAIQAGNKIYENAVVVDSKGGAYFNKGVNGHCKIIDPEVPPPPAIDLEVTAPDWNLGELPGGEGEKTFVKPAEQLCFTYTAADVAKKSFIINASNANGIANNRYRLKNLADSSQLAPYSVTLDSGVSKFQLPNAGNTQISLGGSGRTCFVPTFKTSVDAKLKDGDYSDVLQFTVVTKP